MRRLRPSLTPMIDVVFLLLLFFLLSTQLSAPRAVALKATAQGGSGDNSDAPIDLLEIGDALLWNDRMITADELAIAAQSNADRAIAIRTAETVSVQELLGFVDLVRGAGRDEIILVSQSRP